MRNKPLVIATLVLALTGLVGITCMVASAGFVYRHPQGELFEVSRNGRVMRKRKTTDVAAPTLAAGSPKAVATETDYDFGTMDPLTMGRHSFKIRNEGDSPLRLQKGPTTCKCTLSDLSGNEVRPGEEVAVTLDWNTGRARYYSHEATIYTDDPANRSLHFGVHGNVRMQIGTIPETISFGKLRPDQSSTIEVIVYSQIWNDFQLVDGQASRGDIQWQVESVDHTQLGDATSAQLVRITVPAGLPSGRLAEHLQFNVKAEGSNETTLNLPLIGKVPRRLAVMGKGINSEGIVDLGQVYEGECRTMRFILKVRDEDQELIATRIKCEPNFVMARVVPYEGASVDSGLMTLEIELPKDSPPCSYLGVPVGKLHIDFDHPRILDLDLKLKFAVVGQKRRSQ